MTGGVRWLLLFFVVLTTCTVLMAAQGQAPTQAKSSVPPQAATISKESMQVFLEGQRCMGLNNPAYSLDKNDVGMAARNDAGDKALQYFRQVTTMYPKFAEGWLWLGIVLTERLQYSKQAPKGELLRSEDDIHKGIDAFHNAYLCDTNNLLCVTYYGEALMAYQGDFEAASKLWEQYLLVAKTDMQRVTALTQAGRAYFNMGYFGKRRKNMSAKTIKRNYLTAEGYIEQAAKICPNTPSVKEMQGLLQQYRSTLYGK
ncbi:MAG TPA: hypothetical protein VHV83_21000 [Armatimonadota bacterium]|nr:hypothetical protein [Armatimonadota bacterium]